MVRRDAARNWLLRKQRLVIVMFRCPATNWEAGKQMKDNEAQQPFVYLEDVAYTTERNPIHIES